MLPVISPRMSLGSSSVSRNGAAVFKGGYASVLVFFHRTMCSFTGKKSEGESDVSFSVIFSASDFNKRIVFSRAAISRCNFFSSASDTTSLSRSAVFCPISAYKARLCSFSFFFSRRHSSSAGTVRMPASSVFSKINWGRREAAL